MKNTLELAFNGVVIRVHNRQLNGTDLWRAAGRPTRKTLGNWKKLEGTRDITVQLANEYKLQPFELFSTILDGDDKGVYLHPAIALHFAKYLDVPLYMWLNEQLHNYDYSPSKDKRKWLVLREYHKIEFSELSVTLKESGVTDYATVHRLIKQNVTSIPKSIDEYDVEELDKRVDLEKMIRRELLIRRLKGDEAVLKCVSELVKV